MKTLEFKRGYLFLAIGLLLMMQNSYSQDNSVTRQERRDANKAAKFANFQALDSLLSAKRFILEADFLDNKYGNRTAVTNILNFIKVDSLRAVLQTGTNSGMGYNGVGGVTAEGSIGNWKLSKNLKNLTFNLQFNVLSNIGAYDVAMMVDSDNNARATITGMGPGNLIYDGHLKATYNSGAYKGQNSY